MVEDAELLRRYTDSRSEAAFAEFVERHLNLVYFTALRRTGGNAELAQDIAQAVFVTAARRARTLTTHATLAGWLHTTTRFVAVRTLRKERTRQHYEQEADLVSEICGLCGPVFRLFLAALSRIHAVVAKESTVWRRSRCAT